MVPDEELCYVEGGEGIRHKLPPDMGRLMTPVTMQGFFMLLYCVANEEIYG